MKILTTLYLLLISSLCLSQGKGHLFIIGGGSIPDYLIQKYVDLAGGKESKFLIIPMASGEPENAVHSFTKKLEAAGCINIISINCNKENADADSNLAKLKDVSGIYFTGGDQNRLTAALLGTKFLERIKGIYQNGGVIGGTSAGAAVMSELMLTGNEILNKDTTNSYIFIKKDNIETAHGFGFLNNVIVDQHFIKRKRLNRLISTILEHPNLIGIGIDESTAIIVKPNNIFEVIGESNVIIFDARTSPNIMTNIKGYLSGTEIKMHLLKEGDQFNLNSYEVIPKLESK